MVINHSLSPISSRTFGPDHARHLLNRAGFGGPTAQVNKLARMGLDRAVNHLIDYPDQLVDDLKVADVDADAIRPTTDQEQRSVKAAQRNKDQMALNKNRRRFLEQRRKDRQIIEQLRQWWLQRMISTPRPLEEKLTLLWHGHFATRYRNVRDAYLMYQQNKFFRRMASGSFADLAMGIVRDPAMLRFLNNDRNIKRRPNENLARELMELFTLGEGNYTEEDIRNGARALTGYHVHDNEFVLRKRVHDVGTKQILGQRGKFDGNDFVRILLRHKACSFFIAMKIYRHFVADLDAELHQVPSETQSMIADLASSLQNHEYQLAPVLKRLFKSQHFYDPAIIGHKIKSPAQLVSGTVRILMTPDREASVLSRAMRIMGQNLFDPPSVAGWDGGRSWINTSTLFARQNICTYLITGQRPGRTWRPGEVQFDPMRLLAKEPNQTPQQLVDSLVDALLGTHITPQRRQPLVAFVQQRDQEDIHAETVVSLLLLLTAMPEYQLC